MTIFGFNTDVKGTDDVTYHVQSEARVNDLLLQTQVFVKGHCIGKRASSYAERTVQPEFSNEQMHELLKAQHRMMVEAVREGRMEALFCDDGEVQDINSGGLSIRWHNTWDSFPGDKAVLKLTVALYHEPVEGAVITSRLEFSGDAAVHSQSTTPTDGHADLELTLPVTTDKETPVLVNAKYNEKSVTRKFRVRRN
jgi:hypothetical protein